MGASPLFPPQKKTSLQNEVELAIGQAPQNYGISQSRWTLKAIREVVLHLKSYSLAGVWTVLRGMGIRHVRGRKYIHSPDSRYLEKLDYVLACISQYQADQQAIYFMDQLTVYLHPTENYDWSPKDEKQPLACQGYRSNRTFRICGALNCFTGETEFLVRSQISVPALVGFFQQLCARHPGKTVIVILDNWSVHWHPDLRAAVVNQHYPFTMTLPASWQKTQPKKKYVTMNIPVQLVYLPTYASWLNPIEKLWRWLKQDLIHHHRLTDKFDELKQRVIEWLSSSDHQADPLVRYVGLLAEGGVIAKARNLAIYNNLWSG